MQNEYPQETEAKPHHALPPCRTNIPRNYIKIEVRSRRFLIGQQNRSQNKTQLGIDMTNGEVM
jgi:hypothetical protein